MHSGRRPLAPRLRGVLLGGWCAATLGIASAQNLAPDPEPGLPGLPAADAAWRFEGGAPTVAQGPAPSAEAGLRVDGRGDDAGAWRSRPIPLEPGALYRLHVTGRREPGATGGTAVAGTSRMNRDFPLGPEPREEQYAFLHPHDAGPDALRLGQWHVRGTVHFSRILLFPAAALHARIPRGASSFELGEGESIRGGVYRFEPDFNWEGTIAHRPLATHRAAFNSNRWLFQPNAEVIYRFGLAGLRHTSARIHVALNHHTGGTLSVEAARDTPRGWVELGRLDGLRRQGRFDLPAALLPAETLHVRLRQADAGAGFQVDTFAFEAGLDETVPDAEGATRFVEFHASDPRLGFALEAFGPDPASPNTVTARFRLHNPDPGPRRVSLALEAPPGSGMTGGGRMRLQLPPGPSKPISLPGPVAFAAGEYPVRLTVATDDEPPRVVAATTFTCGLLDEAQYGGLVAATNGVAVWECDSLRKVGRHRPVPTMNLGGLSPEGAALELARGETEAVQVVLRPDPEAVLESLTVEGFRTPAGHPVEGLEAQVYEVAYVNVTRPTDTSTQRGRYPDPLPPLQFPLRLPAGENQPLWVSVRAGTNAPAGTHVGALELRTDRASIRVPLRVRVFDFTLPRETHLRTAFGLGSSALDRHHRLTRHEDRVTVFEKYLRNFAEHRISPYSFFDHAPIDVRFEPAPGTSSKVARVDFTAFDAAAERWLGPGGFNTFRLPVQGMGGGTFHSRHPGRLEGHEEGTPEHTRLFRDALGQIERHLRERGWLDRAFTYWFDEPDPKDYAFVVAGMKRLKDAAPGIRRMLTEQPEPELLGHVDIWCGLTPEWTPASVAARRAAGEEVWWYLCTAPKAPYVTLFLDHPGTELRLWPWQSWQYGVTGLLVWATVYWTSPLAYPEPGLQDPWQDPMSWVSGYGFPVGHRAPWGNGDGRFLYPPRRTTHDGPLLDGPVNSMRWEHLRDGLEDYEYLWLLQQEIARHGKAEGARHDALLTDARALLTVPDTVSRDLTHFTRVPGPILRHRRAVAEMIETLQRHRLR